jgi:hypothetical protein
MQPTTTTNNIEATLQHILERLLAIDRRLEAMSRQADAIEADHAARLRLLEADVDSISSELTHVRQYR